MPLYELFCISAISPSSAPFRDLVRTTSRLVVDHGGVVRGMQYWGRRYLPQRAKRHQQLHYEGDYFLLHFDTSPPVLSQLNSRLRNDPRVIKWTTLKLGERLDQITPRGTSGGLRSIDEIGQMGPGQHLDYISDMRGGNAAPTGAAGKNVLGGGNTIG